MPARALEALASTDRQETEVKPWKVERRSWQVTIILR